MKDEYKEMVCRVRFIDGVPAQTYLSDVEIVRCKDCKSRSEVSYKDILGVNLYRCLVHECVVTDKDFCSFTERKEE